MKVLVKDESKSWEVGTWLLGDNGITGIGEWIDEDGNSFFKHDSLGGYSW